jgi:SNF2 domain-containing protein/helicase-like protein/SWIM zinc finger
LPRSGVKVKRREPPALPAHAALLHADLREWAGQEIAATGRRDALLGRVEYLRLGASGRWLEGGVRGTRPRPYRVQIWVERDELATRCTCAAEPRRVCRHAVATLEALRFPLSAVPRPSGERRVRGRGVRRPGVGPRGAEAGYVMFSGAERTLTRDERVAAAREIELLARRQRARRDHDRVESLAGAGGAGAPVYRVTSRRDGSAQRVTLRGAALGEASCTCEDYAANELGSCRHVERVRMWNLRKKKPVPERLLSVWWQPRPFLDGPPDPLREVRVDRSDGPRPPELGSYFDESGVMLAPPDGVDAPQWTRQALDAARASAERHGLRLDLDPAVEERIRSATEEAARLAQVASVDRDSPVWREIVSRLGFRLHAYQETGALFLCRRARAMLADDMGLGKTLQAIVAALLLRRLAGAHKALVVCPASLKHQWRREIERAWGEQATVVEGPLEARLSTYAAWREGFLILNYEIVLRDLEALRATRPDLVILDEAQRIKNWDTKTAVAVKRLASPYAFILTGTPLENRLPELHSLVEFLHPRVLGPRWRLLPLHAVTEPRGRILAYEGLDVLRRRLGGVFLRRERRAVLDQLPERTDNTFWTGMTALQLRAYRRHAATVAALVSRGAPLGAGEVRVLLQALTSMRILCNAWAQYDWERFAARVLDGPAPTTAELRRLGSPKLEEFVRVMEDLLDDTGGKIVVFSQWERMLRLAHFAVRDLLASRDLRGDVFHGGLTTQARDEMLETFRVDPTLHVLFSTDAGGLGLNLQETASIVVHLEVPWNPAVLEQRVGRVHRLGQPRSVQVLHFVTRAAIEERVRQLVEGKRALFEGLLVEQVDRIEFEEGSMSFVERVRSLMEETG